MRKISSIIAILALLVFAASCDKKCRCYRYDGDVDEFTDEELEKLDYSCTGMEEFDLGVVYSICEETAW